MRADEQTETLIHFHNEGETMHRNTEIAHPIRVRWGRPGHRGRAAADALRLPASRALALLAAAGLALSLAACSQDGATVPEPTPGDSRFASAPLDQGGYLGGYAEDGDARGAATPNGEQSAPGTEPADPEREIEEADIVKVSGDLLYALNRYRGLYVIDIANPDQPVLRGHQELFGYPVEMYIREGRAYVILSNYFRVWRRTTTPATEIGSAIVVVDVSNPASPLERSRYWLPGYVTDTRIVGDVLYGVSNQYSWFRYYYPADEWQDQTHLLSINISDPDQIHEVDRVSFPREGGWDNHVHVTTETIYVATSHYGEQGYETDIRYVDISDPQGQMALGASIRVPGMIRDRWQMDEHDGVFRVVTPESWWGNSEPKIHTFRVQSPTQIQHLASLQLQLPRPESLTACRFDGERAYVVTYERVDPLFVVDLSVPAQPMQAGELEMPGWLDHIVPRGDRLVAFGHDDSEGSTALAISLFNVSDVWNPTLVDRVSVGDENQRWGWLTDERDNYDKLFKVLDAEQLILLPFMSCGGGVWRCQGGVQLVDFTRDDLRKRGNAVHEGYIRRALLAGGRLMSLSDQRLQVLDISDRDHPVKTADLALSRNVSQFAVVNGAAVQLTGDWWYGDTRLVVMPLAEPDLGQPLAEIVVDAPYARFFTYGDNVYLLHRVLDDPEDPADDYRRNWLKLTAIDLSDPAAPLVADEIYLEGYDWWYYGYYWNWWWWGRYHPRTDEAVQAGSALVLHQVRHYSYCEDCENDKLLVVDLADPYNLPQPREIELANRDWTTGLQAVGHEVRFSHYNVTDLQDPNGRPLVRYYLNRLDVSDPAHPVLSAPVNVPGILLGSDPARGLIYTEDFQYRGDAYGGLERSVNVLALGGHSASLRGRVNLPEDSGRLVLSGQRAWTVKNRWWNDPDTGEYHNEAALQGIDLSDPFDPTVMAETPLPVPYASLYTVTNGHAVVGTWWYVSGLMIYDVTGAAARYERHIQTQGWVSDLTRHGDDLYVATGPYGVKKLSLQ